MICFQFLSLTYWYSLINLFLFCTSLLWFAFNFYLWLIDIHSNTVFSLQEVSCDLLSISIFDLLIFTLGCIWNDTDTVVICFQFLSLTYWYSLSVEDSIKDYMLWFAFNFYLWLIDIHYYPYQLFLRYSCDLLSISIFDLLIFTYHSKPFSDNIVVICFQFLSLTYWYSLQHVSSYPTHSCDLLSISIFDLLIFTFTAIFNTPAYVVICFQFLSLTYWYSLLMWLMHTFY